MNLYAITPYQLTNLQTSHQGIISAIVLLFCMAISLTAVLYLLKRQPGEGSRTCWLLYFLFSIFAACLLLFTKGFTLTALKGFILFLILLRASVSDINTRQVPDYLSVMLLLTALIQADLNDLPGMLLGLFAVGLPQVIVSAFKPGTYGGADIKITASAAFILGVWKGFFAIIVGLLAAILIPSIIRLFKKQSLKEGIPLVPYLSFGIFLAFIL